MSPSTKIQPDIAQVLAEPDVREDLQTQGAEASGMSTGDFRAFVKQETEKFGRIV